MEHGVSLKVGAYCPCGGWLRAKEGARVDAKLHSAGFLRSSGSPWYGPGCLDASRRETSDGQEDLGKGAIRSRSGADYYSNVSEKGGSLRLPLARSPSRHMQISGII